MSNRYAVILVKGEGSSYLMGIRKDNGGINFPAGGINNNEEPMAGAMRELYEETGFTGKNLKLVSVHKKINHKNKHCIVYVYTAEIDGKPSLKKDPDMEFQRISWIDPLTVPDKDLHIKSSENFGLIAIKNLNNK